MTALIQAGQTVPGLRIFRGPIPVMEEDPDNRPYLWDLDGEAF